MLNHSILLAITIGCVSSATLAQTQNRKMKEQMRFREDDMTNAISLPKPALKAVRRAAKSEDILTKNCAFNASAVDLNDDSLDDYVVQGIYPCSGADNLWFWVVINDSGHYRAQTFTGVSCLDILPSKTNRFHNIRIVWGAGSNTSTQLWHYIKGKYRLVRRWYRTLP